MAASHVCLHCISGSTWEARNIYMRVGGGSGTAPGAKIFWLEGTHPQILAKFLVRILVRGYAPQIQLANVAVPLPPPPGRREAPPSGRRRRPERSLYSQGRVFLLGGFHAVHAVHAFTLFTLPGAEGAGGKLRLWVPQKSEILKESMEFTLSRCSRFPAPKAPGKSYDFEIPKSRILKKSMKFLAWR